MADVGELVSRIRAIGANVVIDGGKLHLVNAKKLPDGALEFIKRHGKQIAEFLEKEGDFEERSAIIEYGGGIPRSDADALARLLLAKPPNDVSPADWTWFVGKAAEIIDRRAS
ncbi:MAG: hypothetical protein EOR51_12170 [Mesorhizobium sp.]|uniref:hypothetical protein n=1 Tax=Mesorhizobium sp. TaxID=1871066 RepID=UPI000FE9A5CB|nr:hypothetical protein [Mesorhizobium sp.]RWK79657.1 MAG: hypothetical protein EOR50_05900 [Mesorhizobium sp.]RWK82433.1 MAG: hypothetical protein EOR51_12170 [Mesorhizobium sp.]RWL08748.1 MAG: hypothetical protein EOR55_03380 [Mesorhizobium sp.]